MSAISAARRKTRRKTARKTNKSRRRIVRLRLLACPGFDYEQNRCLPITVISGRDQIHPFVAVAGLK